MVQSINSKEEFDKLIAGAKLPVLVDFWATWCGPCMRLGPVVEEVSSLFEDKVVFAKVNIDENIDLADRYGINTIPNLFIFKNGQVSKNSIGYLQKDELKEFINENI